MKKIKAFTILETLIAMIIVASAFGTASMIYVNVLSFGDHTRKDKASLMANEIINTINSNGGGADKKWSTAIVDCEQVFSDYENANELSLLQVKIFDKSKKLLCMKKVLVFKKHIKW